jgi:hypothetical protein
MKLYHDDVRPAPEGWVWARTNMKAKEYLLTGKVEEISMDHDLGLDHIEMPEELTPEEFYHFISLRGDGPHTGLELVRWMVANKIFPDKITIHSWNPVGADAMRNAFQAAGVECVVAPFSPTGGPMHVAGKSPDIVRRREIITPLEVVVDLLRDSLISLEADEKEKAIIQIRQAIELIKVSDDRGNPT